MTTIQDGVQIIAGDPAHLAQLARKLESAGYVAKKVKVRNPQTETSCEALALPFDVYNRMIGIA
jgi:hypothetical protein